MQRLFLPIAPPDAGFHRRALDRQAQLTKPPGSLGMLENLAVRLAAMQRRDDPRLERIHISIFAADHGIAAEGVSAFPQAVTTEMVKNFAAGGAAANVLARRIDARFEVVDVGLLNPVELPGVISQRAGAGTENFKIGQAMTSAQLDIALRAGMAAVDRALAGRADIFIGGEMGIANTCSASAVAAALLALPAEDITGAGTGLNREQILHKAAVIRQALHRHRQQLTAPLAVLQRLGGFEIAALAGAYIGAAQQALPVLVDGFISSVAALVAVGINPDCQAWFFFGHRSGEKGHGRVLDALAAEPILQLGMRLGEASGALMAVPVLQTACLLHNEMATFAQARVSAGL
ncbi:nicotinate-nucleotide--dimethylbenzimidazole phosphoribosyltransferase [Methylomonas sp. SURF-2]|uniref:Nicotinate-nucleotide--dimethylbenzimidazole phosphoribosyltransferase n=1 Tax=Methylomonas subterranea TaxID=2952225 RepID=A0ABT1TFH1_9GAMM|nr:nicotinate-nucleotide--dimethylbenzimidazole phosphoribosyltransferase [Methylomonas sp. SURF-2]MCQ8104190.1 nicotinate-nucleotide--dimethylbenzimidazole phosphoribosyltransferase [Methylomonas sp. SURF-2]